MPPLPPPAKAEQTEAYMHYNDTFSVAANKLNLARHHLVDDHDDMSRRWAAFHLQELINSLTEQGVLATENLNQSIDTIRCFNSSTTPPSRELLWSAYCTISTLISERNSPVSRLLTKYTSRFMRSFALATLVAMVGLFAYRKYHDFPANLWSKEFPVMDVFVEKWTQSYGQLQMNKTVEQVPVSLNGVYYPAAIGSHVNSLINIKLRKEGNHFSGKCGYPDSATGALIFCYILIGNSQIYRSPVLSAESRVASFDVNIEGVHDMVLGFTSANGNINGGHSVWVDLKVRND